MSLPVSQQFFGNTGMISSLTMNVSDNTNIHKLSRHVRTDLSGDDLEVMTWQEMMPELVQSIELDQSSGKIILYVLYIIIGFGMFGTFLMMAKERTYEFGILISIGMRRLRLQLLVVVEMVLLSLAGVLAGVVISFPLMVYMYYHPIKLTGDFAKVYESFGIEPLLKFSMSPTIFIEQAIVVLVLALIMGVYPIWFVHKLKVAEAIRHK